MQQEGFRGPETGARVAVLGTFDTKGAEHRYLAERIRAHGVATSLINVGTRGDGAVDVDVTSEMVASAAGTSMAALAEASERDQILTTMARGAGSILRAEAAGGRVNGVVTLGGGGGTTIAGEAYEGLPVGFPKLIVSTIASGNIRPFLRGADVTMMYSVLDVAGLNPITSAIIDNAAAAVSGMALAHARRPARIGGDRLTVGISAFGVTSVATQAARAVLESRGLEVLVFHATGAGGESMEALIRGGFLAGVLDLTTTELADDLVGGVMSAGPARLTAAGEMGIPQVVSLGALDMVNLGPIGGVAAEFRQRRLIQHTSSMTLMRTTAEEAAELGRRIATRLNAANGPAAIFIPLRGLSAISTPGGPFHDPVADAALFDAIRRNVSISVPVFERDSGANDEPFAAEMADMLVDQVATSNNRSATK